MFVTFFFQGPEGVFRQTPLHLAVVGGHVAAIEAVLQSSTYGFRLTETPSSDLKTKPNLNLKNSEGQTVLGLALANEMEDVATELLKGFAAFVIEKNVPFVFFDILLLMGWWCQEAKQDIYSIVFAYWHESELAQIKRNIKWLSE